MTPLFNKVFVIPVVEEQKTSGGLAIPSSNYLKAKVLFAGPTAAEGLKPGALVIYEKDIAGSKFDYQGQEGLFFDDKQLTSIL